MYLHRQKQLKQRKHENLSNDVLDDMPNIDKIL